MTANSRQVAGSHYQAEIQHWDLIEDHGIGYLEGCATKYVTRWRKKNGLQDLIKADHYVEKLIEKASGPWWKRALRLTRRPRGSVPAPAWGAFAEANGLIYLEAVVIEMLVTRWSIRTLVDARKGIAILMEVARLAEQD